MKTKGVTNGVRQFTDEEIEKKLSQLANKNHSTEKLRFILEKELGLRKNIIYHSEEDTKPVLTMIMVLNETTGTVITL